MATAAGPHPASPSSSPRLPSPPPFTEVQFGPKSPSYGESASNAQIEMGRQNSNEGAAMRRIRPGTKAEDMASGPPLVPLNELDSPFQLQEHLAALHHSLTHPNKHHTTPLSHATSVQLATPPTGIDRSLWLYELCRLLTNRINTIIVSFFADSPPCSASTCPEMRASEWQYLCAVHDPPKPCCAIDYCCHTLDWAANMLTSTKHFPSRLTMGTSGNATNSGSETGGGAASQQPLRNLTNIFRRLYRIFAHAWYQHRSVFWSVEGQTGLYVFFKTVCDNYHLIPEDNYTVPPEAEGLENFSAGTQGGAMENKSEEQQPPLRPSSILRKDDINAGETPDDPIPGITTTAPPERTKSNDLPPSYTDPSPSTSEDLAQGGEGEQSQSLASISATTRRHKSSPSTGSMVHTVLEEEEEEEGEGEEEEDDDDEDEDDEEEEDDEDEEEEEEEGDGKVEAKGDTEVTETAATQKDTTTTVQNGAQGLENSETETTSKGNAITSPPAINEVVKPDDDEESADKVNNKEVKVEAERNDGETGAQDHRTNSESAKAATTNGDDQPTTNAATIPFPTAEETTTEEREEEGK
ncbi:MAG: MOB member 4, phocein [Sclerophora amabilis]|nr:MAG: MOB member 4, phocein [Sclerophora amabilis]